MATGQGTFKDQWVPGFMVYGMGFAIIIPKHYKAHKLNITSAKVFNINSWYNATVSSCGELLNHWRVVLNVDANSSIENGRTYLVSISGTISCLLAILIADKKQWMFPLFAKKKTVIFCIFIDGTNLAE